MLCVIVSQMVCDVTVSCVSHVVCHYVTDGVWCHSVMCVTCCVLLCHRWCVMSQCHVCHMCVIMSQVACDVTVSCVSHVVCHCVTDGV